MDFLSFVNFYRMEDEFYRVEAADVMIVEGILAFYWPELRDHYDMMLFVDTDADTRLARRGRFVCNGLFVSHTQMLLY